MSVFHVLRRFSNLSALCAGLLLMVFSFNVQAETTPTAPMVNPGTQVAYFWWGGAHHYDNWGPRFYGGPRYIVYRPWGPRYYAPRCGQRCFTNWNGVVVRCVRRCY